MRLDLTGDQRALAEGIRSVLRSEAGPDVVRAAWDAPGATDEPSAVAGVWSHLVELGLPGLFVGNASDGLDLDEPAFVALMEEIGASALPMPVLETICAAPLLEAAAPEHLADALEGRSVVAWNPQRRGLTPWAHRSALTLFGGGPGVPELRLLPERLDHDRPAATVDRARPGVRYDERSELTSRVLEVSPSDRQRLWLRGVVGTAAMLVGLARTMIETTTRYVGERRQFGVPVGSFQAVKHQLADAHMAVEFARPAVWNAAWAMSHVDEFEFDTVTTDVSMAKLLANRAAARTSRAAIQCHGGMGYTTENPLHMYAKRTWALDASFGTSRFHRQVVSEALRAGAYPGAGNAPDPKKEVA